MALDVRDGSERWVTQINPNDIWTNGMRAYDPVALGWERRGAGVPR